MAHGPRALCGALLLLRLYEIGSAPQLYDPSAACGAGGGGAGTSSADGATARAAGIGFGFGGIGRLLLTVEAVASLGGFASAGFASAGSTPHENLPTSAGEGPLGNWPHE